MEPKKISQASIYRENMKKKRLFITIFVLLLILSTLSVAARQHDENRNHSLPLWSPSGEYLAYTSWQNSNFEIWLSSSNGESQNKIFDLGEISIYLSYAWDSQGNFLVFSFRRADLSGEVHIYSIDTQESTLLFRENATTLLGAPAIAPSGNEIAFLSEKMNEYSLSIIDLSDISHRVLSSSTSSGYWSLHWVSNEEIVFTTSEGIKFISIKDGEILDSYDEYIAYDISSDPNGNLIFNAQMVDKRDIFDAYLLQKSEDNLINVTSEQFNRALYTRWLNEETIVFTSFLSGNWDVWNINIESGNAENLTEELNSSQEIELSVNPITKQIVFYLTFRE